MIAGGIVELCGETQPRNRTSRRRFSPRVCEIANVRPEAAAGQRPPTCTHFLLVSGRRAGGRAVLIPSAARTRCAAGMCGFGQFAPGWHVSRQQMQICICRHRPPTPPATRALPTVAGGHRVKLGEAGGSDRTHTVHGPACHMANVSNFITARGHGRGISPRRCRRHDAAPLTGDVDKVTLIQH